ncbi:KTSC domain-containing protein [Roseofilum casamattae]|uniref:KTSC domain-containing protein n=1 Tax=Roseofilum casamattae BLCC-M143 TaxID=3022442 RepID=A0ABT7BSV0_9CYAN|nr:KTSC domain-containing protein [Roseofilum casamattae]MDJ1182267.1 KTSC domain-containing protein [Roseofilum casamattae BLCC-M143]
MISAVGYHAETQELEVVFNNGGVYRYCEVPQEEYEGLLASGSKGRYMRNNIIDCYPDYRVSKRKRRY